MGSLKKLWGWYKPSEYWVKLQVDSLGKVVLSPLPGLYNITGWIDAGETWTYASADDPTFTFTITGDKTDKYSVGMKLRLKQGAEYLYFIITAIDYADPDTTVTVYGGTDYDLANAAITDNYYSFAKAPYDFPLDPTKWTVEVSDTTDRKQINPAQNTWYNLSTISITIPIGSFDVSCSVAFGAYKSGAGDTETQITLSTANNSESDADFTQECRTYLGAAGLLLAPGFKWKSLSLAVKTIYYINTRTRLAGIGYIYNVNSTHKLIIRAVCTYL